MSRTRPSGGSTPSPVKHYFEWNNKEGKMSFWDKTNKKNVLFSALKFVVLDQRHTVAGFSKEHNNGIRGSEVKDMRETPMDIWIGKKKVDTVHYTKELKATIPGLKYARALYIGVIKKEGPMEIAKITFAGAPFGTWMNFIAGNTIDKEMAAKSDYSDKPPVDLKDTTIGIKIVGKTEQKVSGVAKWHEPKLEPYTLTSEEQDGADKLDTILQGWFDDREQSQSKGEKAHTEASHVVEDEPSTVTVEEELEVDDSDLPF